MAFCNVESRRMAKSLQAKLGPMILAAGLAGIIRARAFDAGLALILDEVGWINMYA